MRKSAEIFKPEVCRKNSGNYTGSSVLLKRNDYLTKITKVQGYHIVFGDSKYVVTGLRANLKASN